MEDLPGEPQEPVTPDESPASPWPRRQIYYLTIDWIDDPHQPESTERLARAIRDTLEQDHNLPPGTPAARFTVRVKTEDVASEVEGKVEHHHHHHHHD